MITAKVLRKKIILKIVGDSVWEWAQRKMLSDLFMEDFNRQKGRVRLEILKWFRNYLARMTDLIIIPSDFFTHRPNQKMPKLLPSFGYRDQSLYGTDNCLCIQA